MQVRQLAVDDVALVALIDRAEHVDVEYEAVDGQLVQRPVTMAEIPTWDPHGSGPHSVAHEIAFCTALISGGATFLGAFDDESVAGLAAINPAFEPRMAWLGFLHVSRAYRRRGAGRALWDAAVDLARTGGAESMYVSAIPTGSAIGFYLARGCRLANPVHAALYEKEPDDVHLVFSL